MMKFPKFYIQNIGKQIFSYFFLLPEILDKTKNVLTYYIHFDKNTLEKIDTISAWKPDFIWLLLLGFIVANCSLIYKLWKEIELNSARFEPTGLNDDYEFIAEVISELSPEKYPSFLAKLKLAYKAFTKQSSVNNIISSHFSAYLTVNDIIEDGFKNGNISRSTSESQLLSKFSGIYKQIKNYNDKGNVQGGVELQEINNLISEINNILKSLLSYYNK